MREYQRNEKDNPLKTTRWNKLRKQVLVEDKYLCQRCLFKYNLANSKELQAHHIKSRKNYPDLVFERSNIITLCKTCNLQLGTSDKLDFELRQRNLSSDIDINFH
jgi:5-methylcytosine-specific restriction endonuclease McrA